MTQQTDQQTRQQLQGKRVAILATHGFEESELAVPRAALQEAGVEVDIVSPEKDGIRAWAETDWGEKYQVDTPLSDASEHDYHGLVLPGGLFNPDTLRQDESALSFVRSFFQAHKPVAVDPDRCRRRRRPSDDLLPLRRTGPEERRRRVAGQRSGV